MHKGRLLPPIYLLLALVLAFLLHRHAPLAIVVPRPWNLDGIVLIVFGLWLVVSQAMLFRARGTAIRPFDESSVLIQDGFYRFSRNPIYLGMVVMTLGAAILLGSLTAFIAPVALLLVLRLRFISVEERMLEERFGDEYRIYKRRVRRWL